MAGAGTAGENGVRRVVEEFEGSGSVELFKDSIDPVGPTKEEIAKLAQWEKELFQPPEKD